MNKSNIILCIILIIATSSLMGQWVNHTKTISTTQLSGIRSAVTTSGIDLQIEKLWSEYRRSVRADTTVVDDEERVYSNIFGFQTNALSVFIRAIENVPEGPLVDFTGSTASFVRDFAYNFD